MAQLTTEQVYFNKMQRLVRQMNRATKKQIELAKSDKNIDLDSMNKSYWVEYSMVLFLLATLIGLGLVIF